jgi:hypothetical protein
VAHLGDRLSRQEPGIAPSLEEAAVVDPWPGRLPAALSSFVGREREIAAVEADAASAPASPGCPRSWQLATAGAEPNPHASFVDPLRPQPAPEVSGLPPDPPTC